MTPRGAIAIAALAFAMFPVSSDAFADVNGGVNTGGTEVRMSESAVRGLPGSPGSGSGVGDRFEYRFEVRCSGAGVGASCVGAMMACAGDPGGGPLHDVFRRMVHVDGSVSGWSLVGETCFPPVGATPRLTYAMILDAFHVTPWASALVRTQPEGDVTLVGLATFVRVLWSGSGFEPGEVEVVDPARMLGHRVEIRPRLVGVVYRFGDGSGFGPTPDLGGTWPSGRITHAYGKAGVYAVHVEVTWSADFRVDGGGWEAIPESVTVTGPDTVVTVKSARAVLVH